MAATVTYKCPNCDAGLIFDAEKQAFVCEFCLSSFKEEELVRKTETENEAKREEENREFCENISSYNCSSCGAEVIMDKSTAADFCYYCHNPILLSDKMSGAMKPTKIVPFKFNKEQAKEIFLRFAKKKWFVPNDYFSPEHSDKISGVYYPFWVTDADSYSTLDAVAHKVRTWRQGEYRYTETSRYKIRRAGAIHFEDITTSAISSEDKAMLEGILPYELNEHQEFSMPYLQGFCAKVRDVDKDKLYPEVRDRMTSYADRLLGNTVIGYNSVHMREVDLNLTSSHWDYTLMPVWILTYKRRDKNYIYAMNGSTGKIYGELPVSPIKLGLFAGAIALITFIISLLISFGGVL